MGQIKAGAVLSYAAVGFNALAGLLYTPWMVSCIGPDDYALYTLAISVVNFFLMDFGLSNAAARFLSKFYAEDRSDKANEFLGIIYKLYFVISAVIFIILAVIYLFIGEVYSNLSADQLIIFKGLYLVVAIYSVISFPCMVFNGVLAANERFVGLNLCNLLQKVLTVLLVVLALLYGFGVFALVLVNALTSLFFAGAKYVLIRKKTAARAQLRFWDKCAVEDALGFSVWVAITNICARCIFLIMPSILAIVSQSWEIALFGLAASLEGYVYTAASALGNLFMPRVSRILYGENNGESLQTLMTKVGRIQLYVVGLIFVGFLTLGQHFVDLWMGPQYSKLYACTIVLIIPSVFELPQMIGATAVEASANVRWRALIFIAMAVANIIMSLLLGGVWGAFGVSLSICIAYLIRTICMNFIYKIKLGIKITCFFRETFFPWIVPAAVAMFVGFSLGFLDLGRGWLDLGIKAVAVSIVYFLLLRALSFNRYEKDLLLKAIRKK